MKDFFMRRKELIWILEDDEGIRFIFEEVLGPYYELQFFTSIQEFSNKYLKKEVTPDLLLSDLRLGDGYFTDFLSSETMKNEVFAFPFLIVSFIEDPNILRFCFKKGAVDYLVKPFRKTELIVKVERMLQIPKNVLPRVIKEGPLTIEHFDLKALQLTNKELKILKTFIDSKNHLVKRDELLNRVWGDVSVSYSTLNVHLTYLRRKLSPMNMSIVAVEDGVWEFRQSC